MAEHQPTKKVRARNVDTAFDPVAAALQQLHQAVVSEPLPDDFLKLLDDIDAKIAAAAADGQQV